MTSKHKRIKRHLRKRMQQRLGVRLNKHGHQEMVSQIQSGIAKFLRRQSNRITLWALDIKGKQVKVVYDNKRHQIVTVLMILLVCAVCGCKEEAYTWSKMKFQCAGYVKCDNPIGIRCERISSLLNIRDDIGISWWYCQEHYKQNTIKKVNEPNDPNEIKE